MDTHARRSKRLSLNAQKEEGLWHRTCTRHSNPEGTLREHVLDICAISREVDRNRKVATVQFLTWIVEYINTPERITLLGGMGGNSRKAVENTP